MKSTQETYEKDLRRAVRRFERMRHSYGRHQKNLLRHGISNHKPRWFPYFFGWRDLVNRIKLWWTRPSLQRAVAPMGLRSVRYHYVLEPSWQHKNFWKDIEPGLKAGLGDKSEIGACDVSDND